MAAYNGLRALYGIPDKCTSLDAFEALLAKAEVSAPARVKETLRGLGRQRERRNAQPPKAGKPPLTVVISGAGPVGLRCAVESALYGLSVTVIEKREVFSRVNILTLWPQTADDLMGFGAKLFYPRFRNHGDLLHLGTREIQLVLLKAGLLYGIRFLLGSELVAVQAPTRNIGRAVHWMAWARDKTGALERSKTSAPSPHEPALPSPPSSSGGSSPVVREATSAADSEETELVRTPSKLKIPKLFVDAQPTVTPLDPRTAASARGSARSTRAVSQLASIERAAANSSHAAAGRLSSPCCSSSPSPLGRSSFSGGFSGSVSAREPGGGGGDGAAVAAAVDPRLCAALDFKVDKSSDYMRGALQGACNSVTKFVDVAREFVLPGVSAPPADVRRLHFDALVIAEGEWSTTCNLLGIAKTVDKFATAIGLVVNMQLEPIHPSSLRSFVATGVAPQLAQLAQSGLACENLEYLKGETHYLAVTLKKKTLLARGVLRKDEAGTALLGSENVDLNALMAVGRELASFVGIPASAPFAEFHPVKLFDFSSRARCLAPFRVLGVNKEGNAPVCLDLEVCQCLREAQTRYLAEEVELASTAAQQRADRLAQTEAAVVEASAAVDAAKGAVRDAPNPHARQGAQAKLAEIEAALLRAQNELPALKKDCEGAKSKLGLHQAAEASWAKACRGAAGAKSFCPVFPVGDSLLEPFWPQGLGSNRGFHSALDAAWSMYEMQCEGAVEQALIERAFTYDVMLHTAFHKTSVQAGGGWTADSLTRYHPTVIKGTLLTYEDPTSKRSHKGRPAVPPRYLTLIGAALATLGQTPASRN